MNDRERWDARHGAAGPDEPPDARLIARLPREGEGRALDLACGTGRHALELARRGYRVKAWDVSPVALERLATSAREQQLVVETREVDLVTDGPPAGVDPFDLVLIARFLDRPLYAQLCSLLAPGGELLLSTFTEDWPGDRPSSSFRLRRGELASGLPGLEIMHVEETGGVGLLHARRPH